MKKLALKNEFKWTYSSVGGVVRVKIDSGEAIAHLGELDQKKWTVLSCPVAGLEFDPHTLKVLDVDNDGRIHLPEVVQTAKWLTSVVKDHDLLLKGSNELPLDKINVENPEGEKILKSARQILKNLGHKKDSISIDDTSDSVAIFAKTRFNGDGVITPASTDDAATSELIANIVDKMGGVIDRSGEQGVDTDKIEAFYAAAADYSAWCAAGQAEGNSVLPYGADTAEVVAACNALKAKIEDYFIRCKLIGFDDSVSSAVDVNVDKVAEIGQKNLGDCLDEIASYPLARPSKDGLLPYDAINPAWHTAFTSLRTLVLDKEFEGATSLSEEQWNGIVAKLTPYTVWMNEKKGTGVEGLGLEYVNKVLSDGSKDALLALVTQDKALEEESALIDKVNDLMHLYRDFAKFLRNYVVFSDFYSLNPDEMAMFEVGELFIDERCCKLCLKVENMGAHGDMAGLSGMFLIYCHCTSQTLGKSMDIVAVMTDGGTKNLRVGKNAMFYDREGNDWDAVVTKIVDNPINIRQAFFSPYRKAWNFLVEKISKNAAEKESAAVADLQSQADGVNLAAPAADKKPAFDIAKFSGIFAAIGLAIGFITDAVVKLVSGIAATPIWQTLLVVLGIMLVISGPSCLLAWMKLRKRNLGPVLNANGWAINSVVKVNTIFGKTLTSTAKYPIIKVGDPFVKKTSAGKKVLRVAIAVVVVAGIAAGLYFTGKLGKIGLPYPKEEAVAEQVETAVESVVEAAEPVATETVAE